MGGGDRPPAHPNGKADRRALLDLAVASAASRPMLESTGCEQMSEEESVPASVWQDGLKLDRPVGREDDFFELGGHSLLATRIVS
ncbi:phosphopantetheine-binding protein [Streptacidiphilus jiangxiensis]|uniref:Phosphopantetheine attachment site n=1 Tax=Streptacidiphilus jiangxiensis TaxID=235985 RepID=A0A1H7X7J1_STRJI|nr:phosphopantetheine-binding protein [Streptacidiphilus jiangxiensis]SEM29776.1 Phosphopantetheine attachment site [Streptacidiphilus jiangxiensis]